MTAGNELLRSVSRSFYLSLRFLPRPLREPIALAYLLARTTDTIADTGTVARDLRLALLDDLTRAIRGESMNAVIEPTKFQHFIAGQENPAERILLQRAPQTIRELERSPATDREQIRALLTTIIRGQRLDLERWPGSLRALPSAEALREYTYLVAGCVGEFWTKMCFAKLPHFASATREEMLLRGRRYGCGLQLVNILRDAGEDLRAGRCYFPEPQLREAGLKVEDLRSAPDSFARVLSPWIAEARADLIEGVEYAAAIRSNRVRLATALPALIGLRTLKRIAEAGPDVLRRRIKVPRPEVRRLLAFTIATLAAPGRLRAEVSRSR